MADESRAKATRERSRKEPETARKDGKGKPRIRRLDSGRDRIPKTPPNIWVGNFGMVVAGKRKLEKCFRARIFFPKF